MARLSGWWGNRPDGGGFDAGGAGGVPGAGRRRCTSELVARRCLGPVLRFLRGVEAPLIPARRMALGPAAILLGRYRAGLVGERCLAAESVSCYFRPRSSWRGCPIRSPSNYPAGAPGAILVAFAHKRR